MLPHGPVLTTSFLLVIITLANAGFSGYGFIGVGIPFSPFSLKGYFASKVFGEFGLKKAGILPLSLLKFGGFGISPLDYYPGVHTIPDYYRFKNDGVVGIGGECYGGIGGGCYGGIYGLPFNYGSGLGSIGSGYDGYVDRGLGGRTYGGYPLTGGSYYHSAIDDDDDDFDQYYRDLFDDGFINRYED